MDFTGAGRDEVYQANAAANGGALKCEYCGQSVTRRPPVKGVRGRPEADGKDLYQVVFELPGDVAAWASGGSERMWVAKTPVQLEVEVRNTPARAGVRRPS
jgi:hypothetical protein